MSECEGVPRAGTRGGAVTKGGGNQIATAVLSG